MFEFVREVVAVVCEGVEVFAVAAELRVGADVEIARGGFGGPLGRREVVGVDPVLELYVVGVDVCVDGLGRGCRVGVLVASGGSVDAVGVEVLIDGFLGMIIGVGRLIACWRAGYAVGVEIGVDDVLRLVLRVGRLVACGRLSPGEGDEKEKQINRQHFYLSFG